MKEKTQELLTKETIRNHPTYSASFLHFLVMTKKWILDYLCSGKGVIPYEKFKSYEYLDSVSDGEFF